MKSRTSEYSLAKRAHRVLCQSFLANIAKPRTIISGHAIAILMHDNMALGTLKNRITRQCKGTTDPTESHKGSSKTCSIAVSSLQYALVRLNRTVIQRYAIWMGGLSFSFSTEMLNRRFRFRRNREQTNWRRSNNDTDSLKQLQRKWKWGRRANNTTNSSNYTKRISLFRYSIKRSGCASGYLFDE